MVVVCGSSRVRSDSLSITEKSEVERRLDSHFDHFTANKMDDALRFFRGIRYSNIAFNTCKSEFAHENPIKLAMTANTLFSTSTRISVFTSKGSDRGSPKQNGLSFAALICF